MALDLGSQTGWATFDRRRSVYRWGAVVLTNETGTEGHGESALALRQLLDQVSPEAIAFESVRGHRGTAAAHRYGAILGSLASWCLETETLMAGFSPQAIKRHATGRAVASKADMMRAATEKWGEGFELDDATDARWLLDLVLTSDRSITGGS